MSDTDVSKSVYRFGAFELDAGSGELRKRGIRIKLQEQPLRVLQILLEHKGEVVTREQIQNQLWAPGTYVDYDNAINGSVRKLRDALSDSADNPRFIETLSRRGYRFIGGIGISRHAPEQAPLPAAPPDVQSKSRKHGVFYVTGGLVLLLIASGIGWWLLTPTQPNRDLRLRSVSLTAASGWESEPSFSPDGNQVAYVWDGGAGRQHRHIFVKLVGEGKPLQLTSGLYQDRSPAWSPDGRSIAFVRVLNADRRIYVIPALGGVERQIAKGNFAINDLFTRSISWSPDSRFLAVAESERPTASTFLSLLNIETGEKRLLTRPPNAGAWDFNPAFSPDGRRLLFTRCGDNCDMYLLTLSQNYQGVGEPRPLKHVAQDIEGTAWTADSENIIYSRYESDWDAAIMRARAEPNAHAELIRFADQLPFAPFSVTVAPRGARLAYTALNYLVQMWQVEPGKSPESFSRSTRSEVNPEYSPDGRRVVFASNRTDVDVMEIWTCDSHGGSPLQITHFNSGFSGSPRWSPDGRFIAFDRSFGKSWRVYVATSDGGRVHRLTSDEAWEAIPRWSADGKFIYYTSNRTGRFEIWRAPANGGRGTQITNDGGYTMLESADGRSLYYTKKGSAGLWERSSQGGKEKLLLKADVEMEFAVTNDGIYYLPVGSRSIWFHSLQTGKEAEIAALNVDSAEGLSVSPDHKTILFTAVLQAGANIMIVDDFQ